MEKQGWVSIHRKLQDNKLWLSEPFTKAQAWVDLILLATYDESSFQIRGNWIYLKRGQLGWSELSLAKRWTWSRNKTRLFLKWLEKEQQIRQQKNSLTSIITIEKYDEYQKMEQQKGQQKVQQKDNRKTTEGTRSIKDNKDNKDNNSTSTLQPEVTDNKDPINQVMKIFSTLNPAIKWGNTTYRKAIADLLVKFPLDKVLLMTEYAIQIQGEQYAPQITTPPQLRDKLGALISYKQRSKANSIVNLDKI